MIQQQAADLPHQPGVYLFKKGKETLYVGKAIDLHKRVASYFREDLHLGTKTATMVSQATSLEYMVTDSELEALLLESDLIKRLKPRYNIRLKDDKAYKYIKITVNEDFPRVFTVRDKKEDGARYFGPFPEGRTVNKVLKELRRMFPFCNEKQKKGKPCFYRHLNLCPGPCDGSMSKTAYRRQINRLVQFLNGKKSTLVSSLETEMKRYAKQERFEKAQEVRDMIERIAYVTQRFHSPQAFLENPNLREDLRTSELEELAAVLREHDIEIDITSPCRIEAYDMSNTSGKQAVGSMVVSVDGEMVKKYYRRFKVKREDSKGDTEFMQEVLRRRFKRVRESTTSKNSSSQTASAEASASQARYEIRNTGRDESFSTLPHLILVDGGVPQVNMSMQILQEYELDIPLIGLAKKWELIVLPNGEQIKLPHTSPALQLLQRMRDESHRFARAYHVKLREKKSLS